MSIRKALAAAIVAVGVCGGSAQAAVSFGDFENGSTSGFGNLTSSTGVQPFAAPATGQVITPTAGSLTTKVLDLTGSGYNGGQSGGADLGYDFVANGHLTDFMNNDVLSFDWEAPPGSTAGFTQIYQVVLNAPGAGYQGVDGYGQTSNPDLNQYSYSGYNGITHHYTFNYDAYKAQISANPGYLQLGIVTNNGQGAPADIYFDNFQLSAAATPEPASLGLLGAVGLGLMGRRRRRA